MTTLTVDDKYSLLNRDNLTKPIQIQLSEKQKAFLQFFFFPFLKFRLHFEHFPKRNEPLADIFPKLLTPKSGVR